MTDMNIDKAVKSDNMENEKNRQKRKFSAIDAHLDLCMYLRQERRKGRSGVIAQDYIHDMRRGGVMAIVSAIFVDEERESGPAIQQACEQIAALRAECGETPGLFRVCTDSTELRRANDAGEIGIFLSLEGAEPIGQNPELLNFFYDAGVRGLGLAHARRNFACDGARYTDSSRNIGCGLTDLGAELIQRAEKLHMLIDVSHLNDEGTEDLLSIIKGPVIASHSNCRALNPTRRNLTDAQIRAIADRGGVIGINGCSAIISDDPNSNKLEMMLDHIDHLIKVGGEEHVGLGFDMAEMIMPGGVIRVNGTDVTVSDAVPNYAALIDLAERLGGRGYSGDTIEKIYSGNFLRVYREVLR